MYLLANIKHMPFKSKFETPSEQNEDSWHDTKQHLTAINIILWLYEYSDGI